MKINKHFSGAHDAVSSCGQEVFFRGGEGREGIVRVRRKCI